MATKAHRSLLPSLSASPPSSVMGKQSVPQKARKSSGSAGGAAGGPHKPSVGGRKHGGIGASNSFDNLTYRSKHTVLQLGKQKGKLKRPAASLSASLAARQSALLSELGAREKANSWVDERLGEDDTAMDAEEKLLLRFQKERMKRLAGSSKFALSDDAAAGAGDEELLTHGGQALALGAPSRRREEDEEDEDEAPREGETTAQAVERRLAAARAHNDDEEHEQADGDEDEHKSSAPKSKHEVMSEVMLKSKMFRAERAVQAEEQADLMGNLDAEFDQVRAQMQWLTREDREAARRAARASDVDAQTKTVSVGGKKKGDSAAAAASSEEGGVVDMLDAGGLDPTDEFVLEAKQLGLDVRAKATDRLKTDEELLALEKKRLEKLERARLKRMRGDAGTEDAEAEDDDDDERPAAKRRRERREQAKAASAASGKAGAGGASSKRTDDDLETNVKLTSKAVGGRSADQVDEHELISDDEEGSGKRRAKGQDDDDDDDDDNEDEDDEEGEDGEDESDDEDAEMEDDDAKEAEEEDDGPPLKTIFIGSSKPAAAPAAASAKKSGAAAHAADASSGHKEIFIGKDGKSSVSSALLAITAKLAGKQGADGAASAAAAPAPAAASSKVAAAAAEEDELPYTFPAPSTYKELRTLLSKYPVSSHNTILSRMRAVHHVSLAPENKAKMEKLYALLLTHFRRVASDFARKAEEDSSKNEQGVAQVVQQLDMLSFHLHELTEIPSMNAGVGRAWRAQLEKMRASLDGKADAADGAAVAAAVPVGFQIDELLLLKLLVSFFPTSDFRHNVVTPALLLLCEQLNRHPIAGPADVLKGFFAVSLLLHAVNASKRLVPEVLTFLHAALIFGTGIARSDDAKPPAAAAGAATAAVASNGKQAKKAAAGASGASDGSAAPAVELFAVTPTPLRLHASLQSRSCNFVPSPALALWKPLFANDKAAAAAPAAGKKGKKDAAPVAASQDLHIPLHWLFLSSEAPLFAAGKSTAALSPSSPSLAAASYSTLLQLVHQAAQLWQPGCVSYAELFVPLLDGLTHLLDLQSQKQLATLPSTLQAYTSHLRSYLAQSSLHSVSLRQPLAASLAPLALKTHAPLFEEGYNPTKDYDPIKERAHIKELSHKLKREKKGALRELRRDTAVVVTQQRALQDAYKAEREQKRKTAWAQMEEQQRDTNILQKASKKAEKKEQDGKKKKR